MATQPASFACSSTDGFRGSHDDSVSFINHEIVPEADSDYSDEEELSPLEYARSCGFCQNYLLQDPLKICASSALPFDPQHDFDDPPNAVVTYPGDLTRERFECSKAALLVLQKAIKPDDAYEPLDEFPDLPPKRGLRLELPLLFSDHEMDMRSSGQAREPHYRDLKLPVEYVDIENDEGLQWPLKFRGLPQEWTKEIEAERLEFPRSVLKYLQDLINGAAEAEQFDTFGEEFEVKPRLKKLEAVTPPLIPIDSPPSNPFDPSSETGQLPLLSDSTDSVAAELKALEDTFEHEDRLHTPEFAPTDQTVAQDDQFLMQLYTPLQSDIHSDATRLPKTRNKSELMVDLPLLPSEGRSSIAGKSKKAVTFTEQLHTLIPDLTTVRPVDEDQPDSDTSFEAIFNEFIEPIARQAEQAAAQEQLQSVDCLQRVAVPVMDFALAPSPWKTNAGTASKKYDGATHTSNEWLALVKEIKLAITHTKDYGAWKMKGKAERQLQPYPFPTELGKVPKEPAIEDCKYLAIIMSDMSIEDVVTSDDLIWKPEGLRVLRRAEYACEEEDDLEPISYEEDEALEDGDDLESIVRKRQREICKNEQEEVKRRKLKGKQTAPEAVMTISASLKPHQINSTITNQFSHFQSATARDLASFMNSMGHQSKKPRLANNKDAAKPAETSNRIAPSGRLEALEGPDAPRPPLEDAEVLPFHLPELTSELPLRCVIISLDLVKNHRQVLRAVFKEKYPHAIHIERDFNSTDLPPEADILLSPGTGLILTSLQKIKQKALPGQSVQLAGVRKRLATLAVRYELLIVLIAESMSSEIHDVDQRDCEAMAEFAGFCANCNAEIQINYVPNGDENLALWITACIVRHGELPQDMELLQDETLWELTLRRCGLNAYAAQVVLASLKRQETSSGFEFPPNVASFGIKSFVRMSSEERVARFQRLLGGQKVLQRVNKVLEQQWLNAKNGFQEPS